MQNNRKLRAESRKSLSGKWGLGAVVALIFMAISGAIGGLSLFPFLYWAALLLISPVVGYGLVAVFLRSFRGEAIDVGNLFIGFRSYGKVLGVMLLTFLYTALWTLLFIVPGIIKAYSYAMTAYILHDDPTVGADEAIERSKAMMNGHKAKLFLLDVSFIGWGLLCILTLGIGLLWLLPYMQTARAAFYEDVRCTAAVA
ncbi:MAG: DUF975 family protein [Bacteroidales bacterium]|nr:DUF975 family protein [Bacteroidales bacterium]